MLIDIEAAAVARKMADKMTFGIGEAVKHMWAGHRVKRSMWKHCAYVALQVPDANSANTIPYIFVVMIDGKRIPWTCSHVDLLACDWMRVDA